MTTEAPKIALFGAGMISRAHGAAAAFSGMQVVAVASRTTERATERAGEFASTPVDYDRLLDGSVGADVVVVSTPPAHHAADAIALLDQGYAVLVEKPLCTTLAQADAIVAASARHGDRLLYGENLAYAPGVQQVLAMVPKIGALTHLEVRSLQSTPTWGDFTTDEWGGGALFDLGVHPLAIALLCANASGAGMPTSVTARLEGGEGHGTDEWAEVLIEYPTGLVARVESSWRAGPVPVWDLQMASATGVLRSELLPTPTIEHNGDSVPMAPVTAPVPVIEQFGYLAQLRALVADARLHRAPVMNASFGRLVLDVVCAAYQSAGRDGDSESLPFTGDRNLTPLQLWRGR